MAQSRAWRRWRGRTVALAAATGAAVTLAAVARGQRPAAAPSTPPAAERFAVEYYYKVRWGHQQEFLDLFRKNHFPLLEKQRERGRILEITAVAPRYHGTEDGRWDYRVTLVFPSAAIASAPDPMADADRRQLYPDSATFAREEQRRFEILEAHWDLPITPVTLRR